MLLLVDSGVEVGRSGGVPGSRQHPRRRRARGRRGRGALPDPRRPGGPPGARRDRPQRRAHRRGAPAPPPGARHARPRRTGGEPRPRRRPDALRRAGGQHRAGVLADAVAGAVLATTTLAARGLDVVVVDCLPEHVDLGEDDERLALAWRMRLLEREALLARVRRAGIPVVAWRGPGTLDEVLRRLGPPRRVDAGRWRADRWTRPRRGRAVQPRAAAAAVVELGGTRAVPGGGAGLRRGLPPRVHRGRRAAGGAGRAAARDATPRWVWWSTSAVCGRCRPPDASTSGRWPRRPLLFALHLACTLVVVRSARTGPRPRCCRRCGGPATVRASARPSWCGLAARRWTSWTCRPARSWSVLGLLACCSAGWLC